ncbi:MAG TPA: heme-binding domain-containing protein [Aggregatilineales bacterium]|nr:heme-binding domain-containing protein [Aggregatilineales bacterium]
MTRTRKIVLGLAALLVGGFALLQVFPIGSIRPVFAREPNPPVTATITWDSAETERLARIACFDCHSNETVYPWYAQVAPISWLVTRDVNRGREAMNFSEDAPTDYDLEDLKWHLYNDMPPRIYLVTHRDAVFTDEQKSTLFAGFEATFTEGTHNGMDMGGG